MSTRAGRSPPNPSAPSIFYGGSYVTPTVISSTSAIEPTGLTACFPNARASGVTASDSGWAIAGTEASSPPPPGNAVLLVDASGVVPPTSGRWSRGPRPPSLSSSSSEESVDSDSVGDVSTGRPFCLCCRRRFSSCSRLRTFLLRFSSSASFRFFYASACARFTARRFWSSGTGGGEARTSLIPCRDNKRNKGTGKYKEQEGLGGRSNA